ncbi:MAG: hypothetical protein K6F78_05100 [Bacteroidaceae bacterium]|nr:hypothetical protein [Bacteroidaceae bacterium]
MQNINYILVNDAAAKGSACDSRHRFIPHVGHCVEVNCGNRSVLIDQLVKLRQHYPDAKILGKSELDTSAFHAPIRVNPEMNHLRRELSDLP